MPLKVAIIVPPLRGKVSFYPPIGALSVIAAAEQDGHKTYLLDLDAHRCSYQEAVKQIYVLSPDVIGISAVVATAYKYVKKLSFLIKQKIPDAVIVVGGGLSAAADTVLSHTAVDIAVHGEGEITFKELLKRIENEEGPEEVEGISFRQKNRIIKNNPRKLITDLDALPFPDYDRIDLNKYILNIRDFIKDYAEPEKIDRRVLDPKRSANFMRINVSRGCVNRCTFCYRHMDGIRIHSLKYIGDLIGHVSSKYDLGHISFADECFGPTKKWLCDFIEMIRQRRFDLTFHITGMRVNSVDLEILKSLKEIGVWHIQFGFESGSQKILNIMEKNTTTEQNFKAVEMAGRVGINTVPFIILGYPGETRETVYETLNFLKKANLLSRRCRPVFPMAMPGTPLFEYAKLKGFITDEDRYLESISNLEAASLFESSHFINYTDSPAQVVKQWMDLLQGENLEFNNKKTFIGLPRMMLTNIKRKGMNRAVRFIRQKLYSVKHQDSGSPKNSLQLEIPAEGESLRKIIERLKKYTSWDDRLKQWK